MTKYLSDSNSFRDKNDVKMKVDIKEKKEIKRMKTKRAIKKFNIIIYSNKAFSNIAWKLNGSKR